MSVRLATLHTEERIHGEKIQQALSINRHNCQCKENSGVECGKPLILFYTGILIAAWYLKKTNLCFITHTHIQRLCNQLFTCYFVTPSYHHTRHLQPETRTPLRTAALCLKQEGGSTKQTQVKAMNTQRLEKPRELLTCRARKAGKTGEKENVFRKLRLNGRC